MPVLILKSPRKATLESLAAHLTISASGAAVKIASAPGCKLQLIADGTLISDPIAICRSILANVDKCPLYPKKLPKQTAVDSIVECCVPMFASVRGGTQPGVQRTLSVLNQLAMTIPKGFRGIGGTKEISIADIFCFAAAYPLVAPGASPPNIKHADYKAIVDWTLSTLNTNKWVQKALETSNLSSPKDLDLTQDIAKNDVKKAANGSTTQKKKKMKERDVCWRPVVPTGHTAYSWPQRKKQKTSASSGSGSSSASNAKGLATKEVPDPEEWKALRASSSTASSPPPKLPKKGQKNIMITSALPYVNNVPHLGNIIGCVLSADVYSRYCRLRGYNSIYICGTDEYGTTTEMKAIQEKLTCQQICDKYHAIHKSIYEWFNIGFDHFGRTTTDQQTKIAQDIYKRAKKNGYVIEKTTQQLYDAKINKFLADRYVEGRCPKCDFSPARGDQCDGCGSIDYSPVDLKDPVSVLTGETPEVRDSKHMYLNLTKLSDRLDRFVKKSQVKGLWTGNAVKETESWIHKRGLLPRCITRDLKWGTPVPEKGYEDKVFYVWFDAPIGYISITANYTNEWEQWWKNNDDVTLVQFMGKDNTPFHTVIFPCTLIAADNPETPKDNFTLLDSISVCDYLQYEGGLKFSKSRGTGVFGNHAKETGIPPAVWRYYLLSVRPESKDTEFDWTDLRERNNGELINNFGNFVNRCIKFLGKMGGVVPPVKIEERDREFFSGVEELVNKYVELMEKINIRDGLRLVLEVSRMGNRLLQHEAPWVLIKKDAVRTNSVLGISLNICWLIAALASPFMPSVANMICEQLRIPNETLFIPGTTGKDGSFNCKYGPPCSTWAEAKVKGGLFVGHKVGNAKPMFSRIEEKSLASWRAKYGGKGVATSGGVGATNIFFPFIMLTAKIVEAKDHPSAEHLSVLKIDLGPGKKSHQLVSGIRKSYPSVPDALVGKTVIIIENVMASNFKGVKTSALLMCVETKSGKKVVILPDGTPPGAKLVPEGAKAAKKKFPGKDFSKTPITIDLDGIMIFESRKIKSDTKKVTLPAIPKDFCGTKLVI